MDPWNRLELVLKHEIETYGSKLVSDIPDQVGGGKYISVQSELIEAIEALPEMEQFTDMQMHVGFQATGVSALMIGKALIARSLQESCEQGLKHLMSFFRSNEVSSMEIVLLGGISVAERISLGPDTYLCPPEEVLIEEFQKMHAASKAADIGPIRKKFELFDPPVVGSALIRENCKNAKLIKPEYFRTLMSHQNYLPMLLTLVGHSTPIVYRHFYELNDGEFLKDVFQTGFAWENEETRVRNHVPVKREDFVEFEEIERKFAALPKNVRAQLLVSLNRLNEATRHSNPVDKALDLGIAFESLLLSDAAENQQLGLQLRLRGAWLLGTTGDERTALSKQFRDLYELRSAAAHRGAFTSKHKDIGTKLAIGQNLCASAIKKIILNGGYPEWDRLLVGAAYTVDPQHDQED
jgi:hypothetical protein